MAALKVNEGDLVKITTKPIERPLHDHPGTKSTASYTYEGRVTQVVSDGFWIPGYFHYFGTTYTDVEVLEKAARKWFKGDIACDNRKSWDGKIGYWEYDGVSWWLAGHVGDRNHRHLNVERWGTEDWTLLAPAVDQRR